MNDEPEIREGQWVQVNPIQAVGKVVEKSCLWGNPSFRVWLPSNDQIVQVPLAQLSPVRSSAFSHHQLYYVAAAARVADTLFAERRPGDASTLLAPIESSVIPLPHQIRALARATAHDRVRYLLADEVGLGKTIEAGLILRELKFRGLVKRTLVLSPKGLVTQWLSEMRVHFNEHFQFVLPDDLQTLRRVAALPDFGPASSDAPERSWSGASTPSPNPWAMFSQVIVPMDSVKPLARRRGWTADQVAAHNQERFEDLIAAGWDLVIVDEAHRLGGSTGQVARFKLGQGLAEAAPYLLLLSATPHQGKTEAFHRLVSLIDRRIFPDPGSVTRERVQPYVIRTEKRRAIDAEGKPLFQPRRTQLVPVSWREPQRAQALLYEAVTAYVREGYNQARREKRGYIGFLMILMQRLVVSSTRAIRTALEKRLDVLTTKDADDRQDELLPGLSDALGVAWMDDFEDADGQEQLDLVLGGRIEALRNEKAEVGRLLELATSCEQSGPDVKAGELLDRLYRLQAEEGDPDLKLLVFTEFVATQEMLKSFLAERGFSVVCLNGSMSMGERQQVQEAFARDARILVSTDAGGEGLNLQFCHVVINYDLPWNPMRLEQRIGRVDRIGQTHPVRAINFVFENSVEHRVQEVLEEKLDVIFREFGIDKTGDVLDSAEAGRIFDELYVGAILQPDEIEDSVGRVISRMQEHLKETRTTASMLGTADDLEPGEARRLMDHPLPHWVERMTVNYLNSHGGKATRKDRAWDLTWPGGQTQSGVVFTGKQAQEDPSAHHLTLEDLRIRDLALRLPRFAPGQTIPSVFLPGLAAAVQGFWSLWRIALAAVEGSQTVKTAIMPLFQADDGRIFVPTARHVWDQLLTSTPQLRSTLDAEASREAFDRLRKAAEAHGKAVFDALGQSHRTFLDREREKSNEAFAARRRIIERIGLPQVRQRRLDEFAWEEQKFQEQLERQAVVFPEMVPLLMIHVQGG